MIKPFLYIAMLLMMVFSGVFAPDTAMAQSAQDRAFDAVENNEIIDYGLIKKEAERIYDGKIIDIILIRNDENMLIYKLKMLLRSGRVLIVFINANTGEEIEVRVI